MKMLPNLRQRKNEIIGVIEKFGGSNIRIYGSVARGQDTQESDIDLLVDCESPSQELAQIAIAGMAGELGQIFGRSFHIHGTKLLNPNQLRQILLTAIPL